MLMVLSSITAIFQKVLALAPSSDVRFVAITRRDYNGSTPYTAAEIQVISSGADSQKAQFLQNRGQEIATFIATFMQRNSLPPLSPDGRSGGIALLGWSLGNSFTLATVANVLSYSPVEQNLLASNLRGLIMQGMYQSLGPNHRRLI